jgi:hypothetical protein
VSLPWLRFPAHRYLLPFPVSVLIPLVCCLRHLDAVRAAGLQFPIYFILVTPLRVLDFVLPLPPTTTGPSSGTCSAGSRLHLGSGLLRRLPATFYLWFGCITWPATGLRGHLAVLRFSFLRVGPRVVRARAGWFVAFGFLFCSVSVAAFVLLFSRFVLRTVHFYPTPVLRLRSTVLDLTYCSSTGSAGFTTFTDYRSELRWYYERCCYIRSLMPLCRVSGCCLVVRWVFAIHLPIAFLCSCPLLRYLLVVTVHLAVSSLPPSHLFRDAVVVTVPSLAAFASLPSPVAGTSLPPSRYADGLWNDLAGLAGVCCLCTLPRFWFPLVAFTRERFTVGPFLRLLVITLTIRLFVDPVVVERLPLFVGSRCYLWTVPGAFIVQSDLPPTGWLLLRLVPTFIPVTCRLFVYGLFTHLPRCACLVAG